MSKERTGSRTRATLGDVKGGDLLAGLAQAFKQPKLPSPVQTEQAADLSAAIFQTPLKNGHKPSGLPPRGEQAVAWVKASGPEIQRVKIPRAAVQEIYEQTTPRITAAPKPVQNTYDFGKTSFEKIALLKPSLANFLADHRAPDVAEGNVAALIARRIDRCVSGLYQIIDRDADGYLGYDFGTSSTKAVARWPYLASSPAYAIPVPSEWQSGGQPHVWPTIVFFDPGSLEFSLLPGAGRVPLTGFKSALIEGQGHRICGGPVTMKEAATAFLSLHLAYVVGTIGELGQGGLSAVNVAIPVAAFGGSVADASGKIASDFENAVRAALRLLSSAGLLTLESVRAGLVSGEDPRLDFELHAELSGVIAGYCCGPRHHIGSHMIIDCGSATLDMATFGLGSSDWPLAIYGASVELLGSDACTTYCNEGAQPEDCSGAARYQDHMVSSQSLKQHPAGYQQTAGNKYGYQVILAGGGIDKKWIADMLSKWQLRFEKPFQHPALSAGLHCEDGHEAVRLVLADGLARDPIDLRKVRLPSQHIRDVVFNPNSHDWTSN